MTAEEAEAKARADTIELVLLFISLGEYRPQEFEETLDRYRELIFAMGAVKSCADGKTPCGFCDADLRAAIAAIEGSDHG